MKCKMNGTEVFRPCIASCPLFGDCVVEYENELHSHKPTNADRFRAKSNEELAESLAYSICKFTKCRDACPLISGADGYTEVCVKNILDWLTQPAEEDKKNMNKDALEYRSKHRRCLYCKNTYHTPCGSLYCTITLKGCFPSLKAVFCKHYKVEED